jgi:cation:H+ antiporter
MNAVVVLLVGLLCLVAGAELLVRGASRLSVAIGISPLVIGLTIVAFGTSAPELGVSVTAGLAGYGGIAVGNVVGSNIVNVLLILGASALIAPLAVSSRLIRIDVPVLIGASFLFLALARDGALTRWEGLVMLAGFFAYTAWLFHEALRTRRTPPSSTAPVRRPQNGIRPAIWAVMAVGVGLALLTFGSRWLVDAAVRLASALGINQLVVGLTIVAVGTSLPEAATSIVASIRKQPDIAVGNIVGSCIFNILCILGIAAAGTSGGVPVPQTAIHFDILIMIATAVVCLPIFFTGFVIARWEGALLLGYYAAYLTYLVLGVALRSALPTEVTAIRGFVIPLTTIALSLSVVRFALRHRKRSR